MTAIQFFFFDIENKFIVTKAESGEGMRINYE